MGEQRAASEETRTLSFCVVFVYLRVAAAALAVARDHFALVPAAVLKDAAALNASA